MLSYCGAGEHSSEAFASKEIKPVSLKGNQPWMFIRRTNAEAPILWPPDSKSWLIGKDPDAGKDWGQEKKGWQGLRCLDGIANPMELSKLWEIVKDRETWRTEVLGVAKCWTWLNNIMQLMDLILKNCLFSGNLLFFSAVSLGGMLVLLVGTTRKCHCCHFNPSGYVSCSRHSYNKTYIFSQVKIL